MNRTTSNFFFCLCWSLSLVCAGHLSSGNVVGSLVQRRKPLPGAAIKLQEINIAERAPKQDEQEDVNVDEFVATVLERSRRAINPDFSPKIARMHLNDSHNMAYVHWSGDNRETVVVLTRDSTMRASSTSAVWISRDYAQTFQNYTTQFTLTSGADAQISKFYASPVDKSKYIFVDRRHKYVFTTTDDCKTFKKKAVTFTPDDVTFHDSYLNVVLAYDRTSYIKRLYVSQDFGLTWSLKDERVRSYYWGIPPHENYNTLFIEREELIGGTSVVVKTDYFTNRAVSLITGVKDFEVLDGYMFATKSGGKNNLTLMVSVNRSSFHAALIPTSMPKLDYLVADVSENQVFLAVSHSVSTTHLYISDASGLKYSLSLPRVLYFSYSTGSPWLRRYIHHSFVDLHKAESLRGVYIASQLSKGVVGRRHIVSYITFDKGGEWRLIGAPKMDVNNKLLNCSLPNCSLHLSQEFGQHYRYSRYTPMLSSASAPGIIMAMGTIGKNLKLNADVFLSTNGGLTWKAVLKGSYYYNMGDHGGIIIAVPSGQPTNLIYYSWNEGEHWLTKQFLDNDRINVYGLLTEPGEKNTKFTLFGSHTQKHEWVVVHIDLRKTLGNPCSLSQDYKDWIPSDEYNSSWCLMGRKSIFRRRIAHAHCYNGYNFDRPVTVQNCACTRDDYECDVGYNLVQGISCVWDTTSGLTPTAIPSYCPAGTTYLKSKGYRKVVGDTCTGGKEGNYNPSTVSCPISSLPEFLLFAQRRVIKRITIGSYQETTLPLPGLQQTIALDFDYKENCVYWSDIQLDTIKRAFLNGSGIIQTLHSSMQQVEGIALDWLGNNIYWVDAGAKKIEVSRKDGRYRKVLYPNNHDKPRALVLDPMKGYMYWTDWGTKAKIVRADMSGGHSYAMINTSLEWPNGISIDFTDNKLYWTDAWYDRIERSDLDGKNRQVVTSAGLPHPYSITIYKQFMYWDDWNTRTIIRAFKQRGTFRTVVKRGLLGIMDLKVFHKDIQHGSSKCSSNSPCAYLCLTSPVSPFYKCACPDSMITSISPSGNITCTCRNHTILVNGECQTTSGTCPTGEFKCNNNKCIPHSWRCDHEDDCGDGSDEMNCPYATCSPTEFRCPSGLCIRRSWLCDHDDDCGDKSDERNCTFSTCRADQFTCQNHRCISRRWVCDSDNDCRDGSDEQNCTPAPPTTPVPANCSSSQFTCRNGRCITKAWFCDADNDCGDNSDEPINCSQTCSSNQFTCGNGRCISIRWHCDKDNDCGDNSDERGCTYTTTAPPTTLTPTTPRTCHSWEFRCDNGRCVSRRDCGDKLDDCGDNTDETKCVPYTTKRPNYSTRRHCHFYEFTCNNGYCTSNKKRCDNTNDCGDWSDEMGCTARPPTTSSPMPTTASCIPPFLKCDGGKVCFDPSWKCDGKAQCRDGRDEKNCPISTQPTPVPVSTATPAPTCSTDQFPCTNGQCVPGDSYCDNKTQCADGSDEKGCGGYFYSPWGDTCTSNQGVLICDKESSCLQWTKRCDGFGACRDKTDERDCDTQSEDMKVRNLGTSADNKTLHLTWSPSKYQPKWMTLLGYRVVYRIYEGHNDRYNQWTSINVKDSAQKSLLLPQLKPCTQYEFNLQVVWSKLVGPQTEPAKGSTPTVMIGPPGNLTATPMMNGTITVSWTKPTVYCYRITDYKVTYDTSGWKLPKTIYTGNVLSTKITGLNPLLTYTITVQGFNKLTKLGYQSQQVYVVPEPEAHSSARKASKVIWAIPVGIVATLFFIGVVVLLVYFVRKSHRLQGSMYALLRRNGQETGGEVTFHSDDDDPLIRGFADDVPLITA